MPTQINLEQQILKWQLRHGKRLTDTELARQANITVAALHRLKSGDTIRADITKINALCKVFECEPGDIIVRYETKKNIQISKSTHELEVLNLQKKLDNNRIFQLRQQLEEYRGWILKEDWENRIIILRPGAKSDAPSPGDLQVLEGEYAEEWKKENPQI